jgi:hypothetical protein
LQCLVVVSQTFTLPVCAAIDTMQEAAFGVLVLLAPAAARRCIDAVVAERQASVHAHRCSSPCWQSRRDYRVINQQVWPSAYTIARPWQPYFRC